MNAQVKLKKIKKLLLFFAVCTVAVSCNKDDGEDLIPEPLPIPTPGATVLDCDYFHEDRTLVDDTAKAVDYIITCKMDVKGELIIEPGVVIAFEQNAGIKLDDFNNTPSSIVAVGTAEQPILFTGVVKERGYWSGVFIDSSDPQITLEYVNIEYAGGASFNSNDDRGAVIVYAGGKLSMTNCIISNSETAGLNAVYGNSTIVLENNIFTENAVPLLIYDIYAGVPSLSDDYSGNDLDRVILRGYTASIEEEITWKNINVPYRLENGKMDIKNLVTIEPGTIIEMGVGTSMYVHDDGGGLNIVGLPGEPIIIRGAIETAGAWESIYIDGNHPLNEIAYAEISHAGEDPTNNKGAVRLWYDAKLNIHDVTFTDVNGSVCAVAYRLFSGQSSNPNLSISNLTLNNVDCESQEW